MELHELLWLMSKFGTWSTCTPHKYRKIDDWVLRHPKGRYIVDLVVNPISDECHVIAVVDGKIHGHCSPHWVIITAYRLVERLDTH